MTLESEEAASTRRHSFPAFLQRTVDSTGSYGAKLGFSV